LAADDPLTSLKFLPYLRFFTVAGTGLSHNALVFKALGLSRNLKVLQRDFYDPTTKQFHCFPRSRCRAAACCELMMWQSIRVIWGARQWTESERLIWHHAHSVSHHAHLVQRGLTVEEDVIPIAHVAIHNVAFAQTHLRAYRG